MWFVAFFEELAQPQLVSSSADRCRIALIADLCPTATSASSNLITN
jgi:hypothetical protein